MCEETQTTVNSPQSSQNTAGPNPVVTYIWSRAYNNTLNIRYTPRCQNINLCKIQKNIDKDLFSPQISWCHLSRWIQCVYLITSKDMATLIIWRKSTVRYIGDILSLCFFSIKTNEVAQEYTVAVPARVRTLTPIYLIISYQNSHCETNETSWKVSKLISVCQRNVKTHILSKQN